MWVSVSEFSCVKRKEIKEVKQRFRKTVVWLFYSNEVHEGDVILHVFLELTEFFFVVVNRNDFLHERL